MSKALLRGSGTIRSVSSAAPLGLAVSNPGVGGAPAVVSSGACRRAAEVAAPPPKDDWPPPKDDSPPPEEDCCVMEGDRDSSAGVSPGARLGPDGAPGVPTLMAKA